MSEEAVKRLLKSYSELKARKNILDKIQNYSHNADDREEYSQIAIKIHIIESALEILKEDERTFKRIQKNALQKMGAFLSQGEFKEYINES